MGFLARGKEIAKLTKMLEFYASARTYGGVPGSHNPPLIETDRGTAARMILHTEGGGDGT